MDSQRTRLPGLEAKLPGALMKCHCGDDPKTPPLAAVPDPDTTVGMLLTCYPWKPPAMGSDLTGKPLGKVSPLVFASCSFFQDHGLEWVNLIGRFYLSRWALDHGAAGKKREFQSSNMRSMIFVIRNLLGMGKVFRICCLAKTRTRTTTAMRKANVHVITTCQHLESWKRVGHTGIIA